MSRNRHYTYDNEMLLHDGVAAITADGVGQVSAADQEIDLGEGRFDGMLVIDGSAMTTGGAAEEEYVLQLQGSTVAGMATDKVPLAQLHMGDATKILGDEDIGIGRYEVPFCNEVAGELQRYIRLYFDVTGTLPSWTGTCFIGKL